MLLRQSEIALDKDDSNRFLPWLITFMVFLAALSVAGIMILDTITGNFSQDIRDTMTVQIPAAESTVADQQLVSTALGLLRKTGGVERAEGIDRKEVVDLLEPWLGTAAGSDGLPLPLIIDVSVDRSTGLDAEKISDLLNKQLAGVTVDDHSIWLKGLVSTLHSVKIVAMVIISLIALVTAGTVIFATRTGLGLHKGTIDVLHSVGARDTYIARQFAFRALVTGLQGGVFGIIIAVPVLYFLVFITDRLDSRLLPAIELNFSIWISIGLLAPAVALIAMFTARITVMRTLARMV
ncbi:MAG: cell division protein [Rhodospirillales bacterium]|jgi:cell division transport system permease protein|nr:cell division protein [Rhodospirillales bacterium]